MADFRKWFPVLALVALLLGSAATASAQFPALSCTSNAGVPPIIRAEGLAELVGDVVLNCTGGNPATSFNVNWQIFLNTNITSRLIGGSSSSSEALLMVDEPTTIVFVNSNTQVPGQNTFRGQRASDNSIVWLGIPFTPPGTVATRIIRFTNVRANANQLGVSSTLIPTSIVMFISASGSQSVPINNPSQTVAFIQPGLLFDVRNCDNSDSVGDANKFVQCVSQNKDQAGDNTKSGTSQFSLRFREGFATAFKKRIELGNSSATPPIPPQDPSGPGIVFNTESGFVNTTAFVGVPEIGQATQGTRLMARFSNVPAGVAIFVSVTSNLGTSSLTAQLVTTDASGAGTFSAVSPTNPTTFSGTPPVANGGSRACSGGSFIGASGGPSSSPGVAPITLSGGSGTAVWEVTSSNPFATETAAFSVLVDFASNTTNNLPGLGTATVTGNFAPVSTVTTMSGSAPVPRFADNPISRTAFSIAACVTNLLFPFVTNQAGFDTGVAISNTSQDIFGTALQNGACTINYFGSTTGGGAAPAKQTSQSVAAGAQLVFSVSSGGNLGIAATPGFQGYIIAQCAFQYAHGFAFVSDLGAQRLAEGYLALVLDSALSARGSISEVLAH